MRINIVINSKETKADGFFIFQGSKGSYNGARWHLIFNIVGIHPLLVYRLIMTRPVDRFIASPEI